MSFQQLMRDKVDLVKQNGQRFGDLRASVQIDKIFTSDPRIPIEEGDMFERTLPSGVKELYTVLDAGFYEGHGGIASHYQSEVRKQTKIQSSEPQTYIVYNLSGSNSRVNIDSVDKSDNVIHVGTDELFGKLKREIQGSIHDTSLVDQLSEKVDEMEETKGTPSFTSKYQEFIALSADHVTLLAPFIPALTQMLE